RPKETSSVAPNVPTDFPASSSAPPYYHASSSIAGTTKRGIGRGRKNLSIDKKPRVVGMGVFQAANGFKVMNIYSTSQAKVTRSAGVTGDSGYTPSTTKRSKERRQYEVIQITQVKIALFYSQRCHENCSDV
ncbi:hypothetical protein H5410_060627, partial [Solanum commersonii]